MRSMTCSLWLGSLVCSMALFAGCDQGANQSTKPAADPLGSSTSSDKKETHPDQPTGQPQTGEVVQPTGGSPGG
ncbi:MAG: hypothetical protein K0S45_3839 [Nitrospira sp.]|jgi:hypothetical protein|nr:hypothetical protein [Nitrospira sp.]